MEDIKKLVESAKEIGRMRENLRISNAFLDANEDAKTFTLEQWVIIQKILKEE